MQREFAAEILRLCHEQNIHTCLDTSGCVDAERCEQVLAHTDRVLLDIKYTDDASYRAHVGCGLQAPLSFLGALNDRRIPTTLRQVTIPTLNDTAESMAFLATLRGQFPCVDGVELLPFKKICKTKYDDMGLSFPFEAYDTPTKAQMDALYAILNAKE